MSDTENEMASFKSLLHGIWWMILIRGIALLVIGATALFQPKTAAVIMIQFLAVFWLIDGILTLAKSLKGREIIPAWKWGLFTGLMSIIIAVIIFVYPALFAASFAGFIVYVVAFLAIFSGITSIVTGIRMRKEIANEWPMIFGGIFTIIFGLFLIGLQPGVVAVWMVITFGICAIIGGTLMMVLALNARKAVKTGE